MSTDGQIADLRSKPMLKKRLFVALSKAVVPAEQMLPHVAEHLRYMNRLETEGFLFFASGPFVQEGVLVGDGPLPSCKQTRSRKRGRSWRQSH